MQEGLEYFGSGAGGLPRDDGRATSRARVLYKKYQAVIGDSETVSPERYEWWQRVVEPARFLTKLNKASDGRVICVLSVAADIDDEEAHITLRSIVSQTDDRWEIAIHGPELMRGRVRSWHTVKHLKRRIEFVPVDDAAPALERQFAGSKPGEFGLLLFPGDRLSRHAVEQFLDVASTGDFDLIYSDNDFVNSDGARIAPCLKSDWNPYLAMSMDYVGNSCVFRGRALSAVGARSRLLTRASCYDLLLATWERFGDQGIAHLPKVLLHNPASPEDKRFIRLPPPRRKEENWFLASGPMLPEKTPLVSIVIPTRDRVELLEACIDSLLEHTGYQNLEIVVVDNDSVEPATLSYLDTINQRSELRVLHRSGPFNFSWLCNQGFMASRGDMVLLLNNDVYVKEAGWLGEMVALALRDDVGCVGPKLLYPDGSVQHAGVIIGIHGLAGHAHQCFPADHPGYCGRLQARQVVSAVTGACLLVRSKLFADVGLMDENLAVAYNDVDFCLRVREAGFHNVFTPKATLYHHESRSRGFVSGYRKRRRLLREQAYMREKWGKLLHSDPYFNKNLTVDSDGRLDVRDQ
jgi:GT2 family glycosyltransferase